MTRLLSVRRFLPRRSAPRFTFGGRSVLLGGSYPFRAKALIEALSGLEAALVGPFESTTDALQALQTHSPDLAVIDLHWREGFGFEIPRAMQVRGIPFVILTGFTANLLPSDITPSAFVRHPAATEAVLETLKDLLERSAAA